MKKVLLTFFVFIILANIPYVGYFPQVFKNECTYPVSMGNCGHSSTFAILNPLFWLPKCLPDYLSNSSEPCRIHLFYSLSETYNYTPLQYYMKYPISFGISMALLVPYWIILAILFKKVWIWIKKYRKNHPK